MGDIPDGEQVLADTFFLNGHHVVILFDFDPTHNFISKACTQMCQLVIEHITTPYMIRTPRGIIATKQLVMPTPLELAGRLFKTNLIVLVGQGIDVIIGMSWMKGLKEVLDIAASTVHLESLAHGSVVLQLPSSASTTSALHHTATQNLKDISVACEFPDVFPEDLSVMHPDQDVEFIIEL
jgi:hypothetical protein